MKVYYIVCSLKMWDGVEMTPANIAGRYNNMNDMISDQERAVKYWADCNDVAPYTPIFTYVCESTL